MAIHLEANYSKKLGLPGYSSHQYAVTIKTEVTDPTQVQAESTKLYSLLQACVDGEIQKVGYLPAVTNGNGNGNGHSRPATSNGATDAWDCSPKQRELILKITDEHHLDKNEVEALAQDRFGKGVRQLNKLEASGLLDELLEQTGQKNGNNRRRFNSRPTHARAA